MNRRCVKKIVSLVCLIHLFGVAWAEEDHAASKGDDTNEGSISVPL